MGNSSQNRVRTSSAGTRSAPGRAPQADKDRPSKPLPDDVRRNTYTADREPGLHVRGLRSK